MHLSERAIALIGLMLANRPKLVLCTPAASLKAVILEQNIERVESVREVKDVQRLYAQLAQFGRWDELGKLFSDNGKLHWGTGAPLDDKSADVEIGPAAISAWYKKDAGSMDGSRPGSLHTLVVDQPVISLSGDGRSAKGRWHTLRLMGDGAGGTRIQGGEYENEYILDTKDDLWKISLLRYYPLFAGDYKSGWQNVGTGNRTLPIVPYHFSPDDAGVPILANVANKESNDSSAPSREILQYRVNQLNEEDEVRNLQHSYGYYVDRRMWPDVVDLFTASGTFRLEGTSYTGTTSIRSAFEKAMGPEGLTTGILNEHIIFDTIVEVSPNGRQATTRGIELGLIGDSSKHTASWEFNTFRNTFAKDADSGVWKIQEMNITRQLIANYAIGWGGGGSLTPAGVAPPFLSTERRHRQSQVPSDWKPDGMSIGNKTGDWVADISRRLARSAAYDETENVSGAYGYFADDIRCDKFAALHAQKGFKESPGTGWYYSQKRIAQACLARYNTIDPNPKRPRIPFHWRLQPVIHASQDGRSTSFRSHNLQLGTANALGDSFNGVKGGGIYHDQFVLEDFGNGTTRRKLWSLTIDEFYWQAGTWSSGWADIKGKQNRRVTASLKRRQTGGGGGGGLSDYPPDVSLKDPKMGEREIGFSGGSGKTVSWPNIQRMWFSYRNPVSGRVPESYWAAPACVPCKGTKPEWALTANGYQEPPTGPTLLKATVSGNRIVVNVTGGPDEPVTGTVQLWRESNTGGTNNRKVALASSQIDKGGAIISLTPSLMLNETQGLVVEYSGSDYLSPAWTSVTYSLLSKQ